MPHRWLRIEIYDGEEDERTRKEEAQRSGFLRRYKD